MKENPIKTRLFLIFALLAVLFSFSMFYRVSNAVIAPDLMRDLALNASELGILGGVFFYSFALLQIPMGVLLDRVGPRMVITVFSLAGALGALVFGSAETFAEALAGRILLGAGMASVLMGTLKVFVQRFPGNRFSTLSGTIIALGTLGNIVATSPLAYLNEKIGWRSSFVWAGSVTMVLALSAFFVLAEKTKTSSKMVPHHGRDTHETLLGSIRKVASNTTFWKIGLVAFFRYGTFVALQGLWLGPFLMTVKKFTPLEAGNLLMMLSLGMIFGSPAAGHISDRLSSTKKVILSGLSFYAVCLGALFLCVQSGNAFAYAALFFITGFFSGFGMLTYSHGKDLFPLSMSATVIGGVNFFTMLGGAFFMQVMGGIIEYYTFWSHSNILQAYRVSFLLCFICMGGSLMLYAFGKDRTLTKGAEGERKTDSC